ncbi:MAG: nitroreductase family protein [Candidatus Aminicenantes bacterium]|nr:nitroreductase family protein [Candidatus Aminicenantes bacterium]
MKKTESASSPLLKIMERRRSVRRFLDAPVERDKIVACLEAARLAPSAENAQPWRFVVIDDPQVKDAFCREAFGGLYGPTRFAERAPVIVLILSKTEFRTHRLGQRIQGIPFQLIDAGIAGEHLVLRAAELGLGTCWIGWFNTRRTRRFFRISKRYKIAGLIAMGTAEPREGKERKRKALEEIAFFNRFQG